MTELGCRDFHERAPELALGVLGGDERSAAIDHLASCGACQAHLEQLTRVTDALVLLAPPAEPEAGFESRVMAQLSDMGAFTAGPVVGPARSARSWRRHHRRGWLVAGVAAASIAVAGVVGLSAGRRPGSGRSQPVATTVNQLAARAVVVRADGGRSTCQLVAFPGVGAQPARLVIHLDEPTDPGGSYQVVAEPTNGGPTVVIGTIAMQGVQGTLTAAIPAGTGPVNAVRIIEAPGKVKYRATFASV